MTGRQETKKNKRKKQMAKKSTKRVFSSGKNEEHGKMTAMLFNYTEEQQELIQEAITQIVNNPKVQLVDMTATDRPVVVVEAEQKTEAPVAVPTPAHHKKFKVAGFHEGVNRHDWRAITLEISRDLATNSFKIEGLVEEKKNTGKIHSMADMRMMIGKIFTE
jgi:predicted oxidoreductase